MTWGEFKHEVEKHGVKDDFEIDYIDVSGPELEEMVIEQRSNQGWGIWS